jgi:glycosyltransferase involved in cell wall biosynthesis
MISYCVVVPAHNAELFLEGSLESVKRQTVPPDEIVVVDDGSTDRTAEIAVSLGARVITHAEALGPSAARNAGVAATSAPFIAFLDADDTWMPDHAELLLASLAQSNSVCASSRAEKFGTESGIVGSELPENVPTDLSDVLITENPVIQSAAVVRRDAFRESGGYDPVIRLSEDYDLWNRLADIGPFSFVAKATVRRRMHAQQFSQRFRGELVRAWWDVRRRTVERRMRTGSTAVRRHLVQLLEQSARLDVDWAIWTGDVSMLSIVREELRVADEYLGLGRRLSSVGGLAQPSRRLSQDVRCGSRTLLHLFQGQR